MPELQCVKVEDHYVLRDGASGIFLAASQFPKHRETRPPFVDELLPHQAEIDPKYHFLFDAPRVDDHVVIEYVETTTDSQLRAVGASQGVHGVENVGVDRQQRVHL